MRIPFKLLPTLILVSGMSILLSLGFWQIERGQEKTVIKAEYDARIGQPAITLGAGRLDTQEYEFYTVEVRGEYLPDHQILIDNRIQDGRPGYHVVTPLAVVGTPTRILVNRGWIPWHADRMIIPDVPTPDGIQIVTGLLKLPASDFYTLETTKPDANQRVWQNLDIAHYRNMKDFDVQDLIILLDPVSEAGGFIREWPKYWDHWIPRHRGYAVQWFTMAFVFLVVFLLAVFRMTRGENK